MRENMRCTVRGAAPVNPETAPTPTDETLGDGQKADHWVLCPEEREKGFVRPLRRSYAHVGRPGPETPLQDLTDEQKRLYGGHGFVKYEPNPNPDSVIPGRYWTQAEIDAIGEGCGTVTSMPQACAETYAREPGYYGQTFCCGCGGYFPVGPRGEFVWKGTDERVGS